jgi:hypothetical protein
MLSQRSPKLFPQRKLVLEVSVQLPCQGSRELQASINYLWTGCYFRRENLDTAVDTIRVRFQAYREEILKAVDVLRYR